MSYGLRLPIEPEYKGDLACLSEAIVDIGLVSDIKSRSQLVVSSSKDGKELFSIIPNSSGTMEFYLMEVHAPPECEDAEYSLTKMKDLILQLEKKCEYKVESYRIEMQCGPEINFEVQHFLASI